MRRNCSKLILTTLTGGAIFLFFIFNVTWIFVDWLLLPNMLPMDKEITGTVFRGGFVDCKTIKLIERTHGAVYKDETYYATRLQNDVDEVELAQHAICNRCNMLGRDALFLDAREDTCEAFNGQSVSLVLLVKSAPGNFERRQAIRHVWLSSQWTASQIPKVRYLFVLGDMEVSYFSDADKARYLRLLNKCRGNRCPNPMDAHEVFELRRKLFESTTHDFITHFTYDMLIAEALSFDDLLIIENLSDAYSNLMHKSTAALGWVRRYCPNARFVALMDDDTFVFVDRLLRLLRDFQKTPLFLGGNRIYGEPDRNPLSKWYVPRTRYPFNVPDYMTGAIYVMGNDTVETLLEKAYDIDVPVLGTQLDDTILTGVARALSGVKERHLCNFSIGSQPWSTRRAYHIEPSTVAFISTPRNSYHVQRTYLRKPYRGSLFGLAFY